MLRRLFAFFVIATTSLGGCASAHRLDSWDDSAARESITDFVARVSTPGSPEYVPPAERVAVFDNDGTLWAEQPSYFQLLFAMDRVRALAPSHPSWNDEQPFKAVLENDMTALADSGHEGLVEIITATHAGMTTHEFAAIARNWINTARHPESGRSYTEMVYAPMLELLDYLRANGFKVYIVSGGGVEFLRVFAEEVYGVPPENVIGSSVRTEYAESRLGPVIRRRPEVAFVNDKAGKPVAINEHVGRRPIAAFGNSDGDHQMLRWVAAGDGLTLCVIVHHTDAEREWAYDRDSPIGKLDKALDEARLRGWTIIDMRNDWSRVFAAPMPRD